MPPLASKIGFRALPARLGVAIRTRASALFLFLVIGSSPLWVGFLASHAKTIRAAAASGCACVWGVRGATSRGADFNIIGATDASDGPRPNVKAYNGYGAGDGVTFRKLKAVIHKHRAELIERQRGE